MTVGQNNNDNGRSRAADIGPKAVFNGGAAGGRRLPPPKLVSNVPSPGGADGDGMLLGMFFPIYNIVDINTGCSICSDDLTMISVTSLSAQFCFG